MNNAADITIKDGAGRPEMVRVWDPFVRIFHWALVGLFTVAFLSADEWMSVHKLAGYAIGALVALRILWGVIGTENARFRSFVHTPGTVVAYLKDTLAFRARRYLGHNPAGGAMIVGLILALIVIVTSGYLMTTDAYWGVQWVEDFHEAAVYGTLGLVVLHVGGVIFASIEHRENLVRSMITGLKRKP
jgi:cytochrome b